MEAAITILAIIGFIVVVFLFMAAVARVIETFDKIQFLGEDIIELSSRINSLDRKVSILERKASVGDDA